MKLQIDYNNTVYEIYVENNDTLFELYYLVYSVTDVQPHEQVIIFDNKIINKLYTDDTSISKLQLNDNSIVLLSKRTTQQQHQSTNDTNNNFHNIVKQQLQPNDVLETCTLVYSNKPIAQLHTLYNDNDNKYYMCIACTQTCAQFYNRNNIQQSKLQKVIKCQCNNITQSCLFSARYNTVHNTNVDYLCNSMIQQQYIQLNTQMQQRIVSHIKHSYIYNDINAQQEALKHIPVEALQTKAKVVYDQAIRDNDVPYDYNDYILKELLYWFKHEFFQWVNSPKCTSCNNDCEPIGSTQPTQQEQLYWCNIVELHKCKSCSNVVRFPRYNNPVKLLETRAGRCGEWANCFALCAKSMKYDVRVAYDWTDHVWCEIYSTKPQRYIHCDSCENAYDSPLMYSNGWGKKLNYVISVSSEQIVDTTALYVDKYDDCLERRTLCSEQWLKQFINQQNQQLLNQCSVQRRNELQAIQQQEQIVIQQRMISEADKSHLKQAELIGRQTGSVEWKQARGELGNNKTTTAPTCENKPSTLPDSVSCTVPDNSTVDTLTNKTKTMSLQPEHPTATTDAKERIKQLFALYVKQLTVGCNDKQCSNEYCKNNSNCTIGDNTAASKQALLLIKQYQGNKLCSSISIS